MAHPPPPHPRVAPPTPLLHRVDAAHGALAVAVQVGAARSDPAPTSRSPVLLGLGEAPSASAENRHPTALKLDPRTVRVDRFHLPASAPPLALPCCWRCLVARASRGLCCEEDRGRALATGLDFATGRGADAFCMLRVTRGRSYGWHPVALTLIVTGAAMALRRFPAAVASRPPAARRYPRYPGG